MSVINFKSDRLQTLQFYLPSAGEDRDLIDTKLEQVGKFVIDGLYNDDLLEDLIVELLDLLQVEVVNTEEE